MINHALHKRRNCENGYLITIGPGCRYNLGGWNVAEQAQAMQQRLGPKVIE